MTSILRILMCVACGGAGCRAGPDASAAPAGERAPATRATPDATSEWVSRSDWEGLATFEMPRPDTFAVERTTTPWARGWSAQWRAQRGAVAYTATLVELVGGREVPAWPRLRDDVLAAEGEGASPRSQTVVGLVGADAVEARYDAAVVRVFFRDDRLLTLRVDGAGDEAEIARFFDSVVLGSRPPVSPSDDADFVRSAVRGRLDELMRCRNYGWVADLAIDGRVNVEFDIVAPGRAREVRVVTSTIEDTQVVECLVDVVAGLEFSRSPTSDQSARATYPFVVGPADAAFRAWRAAEGAMPANAD